jgi:hypothetical protein
VLASPVQNGFKNADNEFPRRFGVSESGVTHMIFYPDAEMLKSAL